MYHKMQMPVLFIAGYLYRLSDYAIRSLQIETLENANVKLLKAATEPFTQYVIKIDTDVITQIALSDAARNTTMIKVFCGKGNETTRCKLPCRQILIKLNKMWGVGEEYSIYVEC